jgi:hypothetical protein
MRHNKDFKNQFTLDLRPFLDMLTDRRQEMTFDAWQRLVNSTSDAVCRNPDQFLRKDRPELTITKSIVEIIFEEFIEAESVIG